MRESKRDDHNQPRQLPQVRRKRGESDHAAVARTVLHPATNAARTAQVFSPVMAPMELDLPSLVDELADQCSAVSGGDMARPEALLYSQAQSLDAIFHSLVGKASSNLTYNPEKAERLMRLAFKAQALSRTNVEALANMKNPRPVAYVTQANIGQNVQVNNGVAREISSQRSRLQEQTNERLDAGAACTGSAVDPHLEAVGAINRTKDN